MKIHWIGGQDLSCYVFLFRRQYFCCNHMTRQPLHICFLFIRSCNFNWSACVTSFFALSGASFLFLRVINFLVTRDLPHSQKMTSSLWNWLLFTLIQRVKVKWVCVTLIEGYLRGTNRGSKNIFGLFFYTVFFSRTADLRSYCGYFLAIGQLC